MVMGMADEGDDISDAGQMSNVVRNNLVQGVRVCCGVADETLVVADMVSSKLHFRVEREVIAVLLREVVCRTYFRERPLGHLPISFPLVRGVALQIPTAFD